MLASSAPRKHCPATDRLSASALTPTLRAAIKACGLRHGGTVSLHRDFAGNWAPAYIRTDTPLRKMKIVVPFGRSYNRFQVALAENMVVKPQQKAYGPPLWLMQHNPWYSYPANK
ncbi:MAG: hypothetical protein ACI83P_002217 [Janthinobacterium sp.]|jgi:hypothetical protein